MKKIAIFGSTGSIGTSTLKVVDHLSDQLCVTVLAAHSNITLLKEQIERYRPEVVAVMDEVKAQELQAQVSVPVVSGEEGMCALAAHGEVDFVVMAIVGLSALAPTLAAIEAGKDIGLASKEVLVSAGEWVMAKVKEKGINLLPIDSEHNALFQCLHGEKRRDVRRLILTASGGPFREASAEMLKNASVKEALAHPTWKMGPKVTIDSSTLMNKGLEMIEARWLFDIPPEKIDVVIHPSSIVHSLVEFCDGSLIAQMNEPDMINPIQHVLTYPKRERGLFPPFDFTQARTLDFFPPNREKFRALDLATQAMMVGKSLPSFMNGANEILVGRFLQGEFGWQGIVERLERLMEKHTPLACTSVESVVAVDQEARYKAGEA